MRIIWKDEWQEFLTRFRGWWDRVGQNAPVYSVPMGIIDAVATDVPPQRNRKRRRALITEDEAEAERAFSKLCANRMVGVWNSFPILYPILCDPPEVVEARHQADLEDPPTESSPKPLTELSCEHVTQALGYVGQPCEGGSPG